MNDSRKTNNTSFECPNVQPQHTRRKALPLFQGLPRNLLFKKCIFQEKGCETAPDTATKVYLTYHVANIQGYKMRYHLFMQLKQFSLKFTQIENWESGGRTKSQHSVCKIPNYSHNVFEKFSFVQDFQNYSLDKSTCLIVKVKCPTWSGKTREPEKSTRKRPDRARPESVLEPTGRPDRARSNLKITWCNSPDILWLTGKPEEYIVLLLLQPIGFFYAKHGDQ